MGGFGNPVHIAFVAVIALIVLGPKRLPELARTLGNGMREFRESLSSVTNTDAPPAQPEALSAAPPPAVAASPRDPLPSPSAAPPPVPVLPDPPANATEPAAARVAPLPAPEAPPAPVSDRPAG
jgi:sec-independent protein translocase protein TatA